jgi:F-box protein 21
LTKVFRRLDEYVDRIRHAYPDIDNQSPRQKASTAAQYLLSNNLVAIPEDRDYYNIEHNFLGRALFSPDNNSLPIITVIIYCYVVRQFGLSAAPCGFPLHVHAIVNPPPGMDLEGDPLPSDAEQPSMYMDPFRTSIPTPISSLHEQLKFLGRQITPAAHTAFLSAATPAEIAIRCAHNIINCIERSDEPYSGRPIDRNSAHYAALWALVLFNTTTFHHSEHIHLLLRVFVAAFPHDAPLIEKHFPRLLGRLINEAAQTCHAVRTADLEGFKTVKRRDGNSDAKGVKFRIGHVFRHGRYNYIAVVTGWDGKCDAGEEWIQMMGVDGLRGGRGQAFYHAL